MTDDPLEPLARRICEEMGLDPDEQVGTDVLGYLTKKERQDKYPDWIPAVAMYVKRWRLYRDKADEALAINRAMFDVDKPPPGS